MKTNVAICLIICCLLHHPLTYGKSIAQTTNYPAFCQLDADNEAIFANFKRNPTYQQILEHVNFHTGKEYLEVIIKDYPFLIPYFEQFRQNDAIGNPITYSYGDYGVFSPTTLRYIKSIGDLQKKFGDLSQMHIVEIGGGYGGELCTVLSNLGFGSYTLIDLPECIALAKKYIELQGISNVLFIESTNIKSARAYDLVICNYAFSEIDKIEQFSYLENISLPSNNGYMILNFISQYCNVKSLTLEELVSILSNTGKYGIVENENPSTAPDNVLIT